MAFHFIYPNPNGPYQAYPRRQDRQFQEPTARNAQGLFSPNACLFVGNLEIGTPPGTLAREVQERFSAFGRCHVKIKLDKRNLPGAFVQFERIEDAESAMAWRDTIRLRGRWLRIERARGKRTACFGLRNLMPVDKSHVDYVLSWHGPIESCSFEPIPLAYPGQSTVICRVTFAFVDDYKDAVKFFRGNREFYLTPLDIEGNPLVPRQYLQPPGYHHHNGSPRRPRSREAVEPTRDKGNSRMPLPAEYQLKTGRTIEQYVRDTAQELNIGLNEKGLLDVVEHLETERREKCREAWADSSPENSDPQSPSSSVFSSTDTMDSTSTIAAHGPESKSKSKSISTDKPLPEERCTSSGSTPSTIRSRSRSKSI